jgi:hypothetical protein
MEHGVNKMNNEILKKIVESQNWNNTNLPDYLSKEHIQNLLYNIIDISQKEDANVLGNQVINSVGNNHQGIFFPIAEDLIDILVVILNNSENNYKRKLLILGILNDLYYFDLDSKSKEDLNLNNKYKSIKSKLSNFSDENFQNFLKN